MNKTLLIAQSEFLRRVRSKLFIAATLLVPFLAVAALALPLLAFDEDEGARIVVVDETGRLADDVETALGEMAIVTRSGAPLDTLRALVLAGDVDGALVLPAGIVAGSQDARYYAKGGLESGSSVRSAVREAVRRERARVAGASADAVAAFESDVSVRRVTVSEDGDAADDALGRFLLANFLSLLIYISILIYGMMVMRGVIEEKANRIVEVIASSVRPFELMMGKVLGIGAVGLVQLTAWAALMVGLSLAAGPLFLALAPDVATSPAGGADLPLDPAQLSGMFAPGLMLAFVFFFLGGYLLYSSLFAAVGSAVDQEADAQSLQMPVILPIMLPILFLGPVAANPDGPLALFMSLFPLTSPILMVVRMAVTDVPAWQIGLSFVLLVAAFVGVIALAARIYRVGILMYGKKATLTDLWRWLRTA
ncbi:ABC transporter permease [Rubrivirga sp. IMCC43871]|uniref:ABC transporter permease n=1 Tax=Rubrivirga sp. IMCC43871 TaxID=3391575 RepID=UPI0039902DC6